MGYIDIQDFCAAGNESIQQILRTPVFFPEVKPLPDLLDAMVEEKLEVVFLCDEYGGISGMVTHQQIASEIIGAIPGDIHTVKENVIAVEKGVFIAAGTRTLNISRMCLMFASRRGAMKPWGAICARSSESYRRSGQFIKTAIFVIPCWTGMPCRSAACG